MSKEKYYTQEEVDKMIKKSLLKNAEEIAIDIKEIIT